MPPGSEGLELDMRTTSVKAVGVEMHGQQPERPAAVTDSYGLLKSIR